jgi:hemolysin activation/secretion protein
MSNIDGSNRRAVVRFKRLLLALLMAAAMPAAGGETVRLAGVIWNGVTPYTPETLLDLYRADLGSPIDELLRERVAAAAINRYRSDGYLAPVVSSTVHESAGVLILSVREAVVTHVNVAGTEHVKGTEFWTAVEDLKAERPLRPATFDAWLKRVNAFDDMAVTGSLTPIRGGSAERIATVSVVPSRWTALVHVDNRAPEVLGYELVQGQVAYRFANPRAGTISFAGAVALDRDRLRFGALTGNHEVNGAATALQWSYSRSVSRLPTAQDSQNDYDRERITIGVRQPVHRVAAARIDLFSNLTSYDVEQQDTAGQPVREDRIRAIDIGVSLSHLTASALRQDLTVRVTHGIDGIGAEWLGPLGVQAPTLDYLRADLSYRLTRRFLESWQAQLALQAQVSNDQLPVSEQFLIGGRQLGGAFDPASVAGDEGIGVRLETSRDLQTSMRLQLYGYYDHGFSRANDPNGRSDSASSIGTGIRVGWRSLSGSLEVALPIDKPRTNPIADAGTRVFFTLTQRIP